MTGLERDLRASRPAPVAAPEHREHLRRQLLAACRATESAESWSASRYLLALGCSLLFTGAVGSLALFLAASAPPRDSAWETLARDMPPAPAGAQFISPIPDLPAREPSSVTLATYSEHRQLLQELLAQGS